MTCDDSPRTLGVCAVNDVSTRCLVLDVLCLHTQWHDVSNTDIASRAFTRWHPTSESLPYALVLDVVFSVTYTCTWQALSHNNVLPDFNQSKLCIFHMWTSCVLKIQVDHNHYSPVYCLVALSVLFLFLFNWQWPTSLVSLQVVPKIFIIVRH